MGSGLDINNFQRIGSISNTRVGSDFESIAQAVLATAGIQVEKRFRLPVGINAKKKVHSFDLGSASPPIIVECKSHRWTTGGNMPSAKMTVWNEAMYYFSVAPTEYRKILFVLRDHHQKRGVTLAEYYLDRHSHLIPEGVEIWEYDEGSGGATVLK